MSAYLKPLDSSTLFNESNYNYQDNQISLKYADQRYANANDDSDQYKTTKTKVSNISFDSATSTTTITGKFKVSGTGTDSVIIGDVSGNGNDNICIGKGSGNNNSNKNVIVGRNCSSSLTTTNDGSVILGYEAGKLANKSLVAVGYNAGKSWVGTSVNGSTSTFVGYECGLNNVSGNQTAYGYQALMSSASATNSNNTAVGHQSGKGITTGTSNTSVGLLSLGSGTITGSNSVAIGANALYAMSSGTQNSAVGSSSLFNCSGNYNTGVGYHTGYDITTGSNNLCLGHSAGKSTSPSGSITTGSNIICLGDSNIASAYIQVAWTVVSDQRDKIDIQPNLTFNGLEYIMALQPKMYKMNDRNKYIDFDEEGNAVSMPNDGSRKDASWSIGLISQEVQQVEQNLNLPNEFITNSRNPDKIGVRYEALTIILIDALKRQQEIINDLIARIEILENK